MERHTVSMDKESVVLKKTSNDYVASYYTAGQ